MQRHILVLDGLRGVAAVAVVFYHFGERLPDFAPMQHGYLAVDFFFLLSGFVIAHAYEARLSDGMGLARFLAVRAIRLMPLLVLGLCVGAVLELGRPGIADARAHLLDVVTALVFGSALIPLPVSLSLEQVLFPLNSVVWSLSLEIAINIAYAALAPRLRSSALAGIVAAGAVLLVAAALHFDGLDCGSGFGEWWGGAARVLFSFPAGVLLYRLRERLHPRPFAAPIAMLSAAILTVLAVPQMSGALNAAYDLLIVLLVCPAVVLAGANAQAGALAPLCRFGGDLSYPLYVLHYRLVSVVTFKIKAYGLGPIGQAGGALAASLVIAGFAYAAFRLYDEPVRAFLTRRPAAATTLGRGQAGTL